MSYSPQEGLDYIINFYDVAGVGQDAEREVIDSAFKARLKEFHPDRLQGLAPEFIQKGEAMTRLLARAKGILLDDSKRGTYDQILTTWEGPISTDGTPVMFRDDYFRACMAAKTPEEIEGFFADQRRQATTMLGYDPKQQTLFGRLFEAAEDSDKEELRAAYDETLLDEDRVWATEERERGKLLGLPEHEGYAAALGHADTVQLAIENARVAQTEIAQRRALGNASVKLALLAGESTPPSAEPTVAVANTSSTSGEMLPHYFDSQAERVLEIAHKRQALLTKRLELFQPTYPIAEIQTEARPHFVIGSTADAEHYGHLWLAFSINEAAKEITNVEVPEEVAQLLQEGKYEEVYASGFNILTFVHKEHIDIYTLLSEAYNKHMRQYHPGFFAEK